MLRILKILDNNFMKLNYMFLVLLITISSCDKKNEKSHYYFGEDILVEINNNKLNKYNLADSLESSYSLKKNKATNNRNSFEYEKNYDKFIIKKSKNINSSKELINFSNKIDTLKNNIWKTNDYYLQFHNEYMILYDKDKIYLSKFKFNIVNYFDKFELIVLSPNLYFNAPFLISRLSSNELELIDTKIIKKTQFSKFNSYSKTHNYLEGIWSQTDSLNIDDYENSNFICSKELSETSSLKIDSDNLFFNNKKISYTISLDGKIIILNNNCYNFMILKISNDDLHIYNENISVRDSRVMKFKKVSSK